LHEVAERAPDPVEGSIATDNEPSLVGAAEPRAATTGQDDPS